MSDITAQRIGGVTVGGRGPCAVTLLLPLFVVACHEIGHALRRAS